MKHSAFVTSKYENKQHNVILASRGLEVLTLQAIPGLTIVTCVISCEMHAAKRCLSVVQYLYQEGESVYNDISVDYAGCSISQMNLNIVSSILIVVIPIYKDLSDLWDLIVASTTWGNSKTSLTMAKLGRSHFHLQNSIVLPLKN